MSSLDTRLEDKATGQTPLRSTGPTLRRGLYFQADTPRNNGANFFQNPPSCGIAARTKHRLPSRAGRTKIQGMRSDTALLLAVDDVTFGRLPGDRGAPGGTSRGP